MAAPLLWGRNGAIIGQSAVAFLIGLAGIPLLIAVGEAANNAITAFAAVSLTLALLAGLFSWAAPRAWPAIALAVSAPVAVLAVLGAWSSPVMIPGAIGVVALALGGAFLGRWLRSRRAGA
jgi:hypothetical protein